MLKDFNYLDNEYKEKFLKMCLLLFPQYRSARIKRDGTVIFVSKLSLFKRIKIPFFNLISHDIAIKLSILRWNSEHLVKEYFSALLDIKEKQENTRKETIEFVREAIDFLYSKFLVTKLRDIYSNYYDTVITSSGYVIEKENLSDSIFITSTKGKVNITKKVFSFKKLAENIKCGYFTVTISIMIIIATSIATLSNITIKSLPTLSNNSIVEECCWKIIYSS